MVGGQMTEDRIAQELGEISGKLETFMAQSSAEVAESKTYRRDVMAKISEIEVKQTQLAEGHGAIKRRLTSVENATNGLVKKATVVAGGVAVVMFLGLLFRDGVAEALAGIFITEGKQ